MKKLYVYSIGLAIVVLGASFGVRAYAQSTTTEQKILIIEVQPGSTTSATNEYVELYNAGFREQSLKGWKVQYKSASGASWLTKSELTGDIAPGGRYLLASFDSVTELKQDTLGSGMAQASGHVRIINESAEEVDLLGWGEAQTPLIVAAPSPTTEQALKRLVDEDGYFSVEGNNFEDWTLSENPTPHGDKWAIESTTNDEEDDDQAGSPQPSPTPTIKPKPTIKPVNTSTAKVEISEFLPDPKSPQKDAEDEFVELSNPNKFAVNLEGYTLESGSNYRYSFVLPKVSIGPGAYLALFSIDTGLTLPNAGSQLRLLSPAGAVLSEFVYDSSKQGLSWAKGSDGKWAMSATPTPNAPNVITQDVKKNSTSGSGASSGSKAKKTLGANATKLSAGSAVSGQTSEEATSGSQARAESGRKLNNLILAGVGILALLYAVYEYRHDIGNRIQQLRSNRANRRENRRAS